MTASQVLKELESLGTEQTRKVLRKHGAREPLFGVKIGDMQPLRKKLKIDYQLALKTAEAIGEVSVDHGDTSCKTPNAPDYIRKVKKMNRVGKKRKSAKC